MAVIKGKNVALYVKNPQDSTFSLVGATTDTSFNIGGKMIDITSKDSQGWSEFLPSNKEWSVENQGFILADDEAQQKVLEAIANEYTIVVKFEVGTSVKTGYGFVKDYKEEGSVGDAAKLSLTLQGTGPLQ